MKKLLLVSFTFLAFSLVSNAQACQKSAKGASCCANKAKSEASAAANTNTAEMTIAEIAAAEDPSIMKRVCPETGTVTFYKKSVTETSGLVNWNQVAYDESSKTFNAVASANSSEMKGEQKSEMKASCCDKDKAKGKSCCADKKAGTK